MHSTRQARQNLGHTPRYDGPIRLFNVSVELGHGHRLEGQLLARHPDEIKAALDKRWGDVARFPRITPADEP